MNELNQEDDDGKFESKVPSQDVHLLEVEEKCLQPLPDVKSEPEEIEEDFTKAEPKYCCTMKTEEEETNVLYQLEPFAKEQIQKHCPSSDSASLRAEGAETHQTFGQRNVDLYIEEDFTKAEPKYCCTMKTEEEETNLLYQQEHFAKEEIQGLDEIIKNENSINDYHYIKNKEDQKFISRIFDRSRKSTTHGNEVNVEPDRNCDIPVTNHNAPIHIDKRPFTCEVCGKSFLHINGLNTHLLYHTGDRQYSCKMCGKSFNQRCHLKEHLLIHTSDRKFCCEVCGKSFKQKSAIKRHMRIHTNDRPFSCEVCGKSFNYRKSLKVHLLNHTGDRPISCEVCGKSFNYRNSLKIHLLNHTGDRPFSCEVCGKSFNRRDSLKAHLIIHTGDRPFPCEVCGKCFSHRCSLKVHLLIHTGDHPFSCELCGKSFKQRIHLKRHLVTHTGVRPI